MKNTVTVQNKDSGTKMKLTFDNVEAKTKWLSANSDQWSIVTASVKKK